MQKIFGILALFIFSIFLYPFSQIRAESPPSSKLLISEIKLGDGAELTFPDGSKSREFVTLYNQSSETISLSGWKLEYVKSDFSSSSCASSNWPDTSATKNLSGSIAPGGLLTIKRALNDGVDGSLRLIDSNGGVNDLVGWGSSAPCYEGARTITPADGTGNSLQRYLECDLATPIDTNDNSLDFLISSAPRSFVDNCPIDNEPTEDPTDDPQDNEGGIGSGPSPTSSCEGIIINEILVNPTGADDNEEFIEIFNPSSSTISLDGCKLQTSANSKIYNLPNSDISSGQFIAFYGSQTGLTLANSSGGEVYLIDSDNTELNEVSYPADLEDDKSWALINGEWAETFSLTPGSINQLLVLKPCPEGQFRNQDTNRCNNIILAAAGLSDCKPGQTRNFETNRCRSSSVLSSSLKACASDQYRNPETNRCKNINSASSLAECKEGQERNPETNRCRNVAGLVNSDIDKDVTDVFSEGSSMQISWLVAIGSLFGALLYGAWEWRNDLAVYFISLKAKLS